MARGISARLTPADGRKFGLLVGGAFLIIGVLSWRRAHMTTASVALVLGGVLVLAGLAVPARLGPVYRGWMALAQAMSKVTTPIFMAVVYFLVLTPLGAFARLLGHRPVAKRHAAATYWQCRDEVRQSSMDHQF